MKTRLAWLAVLAPIVVQAGWAPERRRPQFPKDPGYAVFPYVFDLPGIGKGYGVLGGVTNVGGGHADLMATAFTGDANGQAVGINAVHILPRRLILDAGGFHLSRASIQSYFSRGMDSSKDDYSLAEFGSTTQGAARLTATFFDRRAEAYLGFYGGSAVFKALRDKDGVLLAESDGSGRTSGTTRVAGARLDLTDDHVDPRRGALLEPSLWHSPRRGSGPSFYLSDVSATAFVPVGRRNTWAFNFLQSDAHVLRRGLTDPAAVEAGMALDCASIPDAAGRAQCLDYVDTAVQANARGTATRLGGISRLRSYPEGRFQGAHAAFVGTEFRLNVSDRVIPINVYVLKDIRTAVQFAFFYELGTVADQGGDLWKKVRVSYGAGFRLATASGLVYRLDLAAGQEGAQPSIFFQYPWQL